MNESSPFGPFMDEYFAECDEHLGVLRRALLGLEDGGGHVGDEVRAIARALHTIKGLSGMVGFPETERTAHVLEDVLRASGPAPSAEALEAMFRGTRLLEHTISERRDGRIATIDADLERLHADAAEVDASATDETTENEELTHRLRAALDAGRSVYEFHFTPAQELAARGITVEAVRQRLTGAGDIVYTTPRVLAGGRIAFRFVLVTTSELVPPEEWKQDGLAWVPVTLAPSNAIEERAPETRLASSNVVRVELSRLDELMRLVGELVVGRARLDDALRSLAFEGSTKAWDALHDVNGNMERQLRDLREAVMRVRLVPIGEAFERLRFAIREVARDLGRHVHVHVEGGDTEIDKLLVERMLEPLLHLVRNAVSHGIEPSEERLAVGKSAEGTIVLRASSAGERILIDVEDDGCGIDAARVIERARAGGRIISDAPDAAQLLDVLSMEGFSTRTDTDLASGRGVGMAVVRDTVHELGGDIQLHSEAAVGTRFRIELPLTLMIVDALLVEVGSELLAVPQPALLEVLQIESSAITKFENNEVVMYRGGVLPLLRLRRVFALEGPASQKPPHVLVIGNAAQPIGLLVDRIAGLREIVVRPLADPLVTVPGIAGATELNEGRLVLILDTSELARMARERGNARTSVRAYTMTKG